MSVSRNDLQKNIFSKLENFVTNKECDYQFDIQKCYIDYQEEDKKYISTIKHFKEQEFIPNARFSMGEYKDDEILIIIGEQEIEINDEVLTSIEIDLPIFLYGIYELNGQVNYGKSLWRYIMTYCVNQKMTSILDINWKICKIHLKILLHIRLERIVVW